MTSGIGPAPRLPLPCLMLVSDRARAGGSDKLVAAAEKAVAAGVNAVQLREKGLSPGELLALAQRLRRVTLGRALLLVNGSLDVAVKAHADGLHLPEMAPLPKVPANLLWGRSVHSFEAAVQAADQGAHYLIAGPVFPTPSHPGREPLGLREFARIAVSVPVPVIAIGGITAEEVPHLMRARAAGVAVISAILGERSVSGGARILREAIDVACAPANGVHQ